VNLPIELALDSSQASMTDEQFWDLISQLDWSHTGDDEAVIKPVVAALAGMGADAAAAFDDMLAQKLYQLDTKAHAQNIGEYAFVNGEDDQFSVDWFLYARCVVVANGKAFFTQVLNNPSKFPKDMEFEALLAIAPHSYERVTGREFDHIAPTSYETYSNRAGWV
jgi:hypothetical protein